MELRMEGNIIRITQHIISLLVWTHMGKFPGTQSESYKPKIPLSGKHTKTKLYKPNKHHSKIETE